MYHNTISPKVSVLLVPPVLNLCLNPVHLGDPNYLNFLGKSL